MKMFAHPTFNTPELNLFGNTGYIDFKRFYMFYHNNDYIVGVKQGFDMK